MKKLNPDYVNLVAGFVNPCPYFQLLSMEIKSLSAGQSEILLKAGQKHLQPYGIIHGGVCASLIDAACFWAVFSKIPEDAGLTTVDLKLNYLAPVVSGTLIARGTCIKAGKSIGLGRAEVVDENGNLVAEGASSLMLLPNATPSNGNTPSKFID